MARRTERDGSDNVIPFPRRPDGARDSLHGDQTAAVLKSGWLTQGSQARLLEGEAAQLLGTPNVVPVAGGAVALHLALLALELAHDDEVVLPSLASPALANLIVLAGGRPVFAEIIAPEAPVIDPDDVARQITASTRAIVCSHTGGYPAPAHALAELAAERGVVLIEECWQALGASIEGSAVGTIGRLGVFALQRSPDGGGFVACADDALRRRIQDLRSSAARPNGEGFEHDFEVILANGYRINEASAAAGVRSLRHLPQTIQERQAIVETMRQRAGQGVSLAFAPGYLDEAEPSYKSLLLLVDSSERLHEIVRRARVARVGFAIPAAMHRLPPHNAHLPRVSLPKTEACCARAIELAVDDELLALDLT